MKTWDSKRFLSAPTWGRYRYVAFHELTPELQRQARRRYPHKSVGGMYDFADEHFYYPITKDGRLPATRGADRSLAIPLKSIQDAAYMASLGYRMNPGWPREQHHGSMRRRSRSSRRASRRSRGRRG
jgi:hypothetical protein